jgi:hypothetical protein
MKLPALGIKINTRRKVEAAVNPAGEVLVRWTKNRNDHTHVRLTRKAAEATVTLLIELLARNPLPPARKGFPLYAHNHAHSRRQIRPQPSRA